MRARGQWTRGTRGDPAELPHRLAVGYGGNDERRLPCRGTDIHKHWNKIKTFQNGKQNGVNGRRLRFWSGLLSRCTHEGGTGTRRRGYKLKLCFLIRTSRQDMTGQGSTHKQDTPGITSRPDNIKLNRHELIYTGKS